MECISGHRTVQFSRDMLVTRIASYREVAIDIGTGDGRYVQHEAKIDPSRFVVGIDACREQLRATSRRAPHNALFVIANALALPDELSGCATALTINFPWGSLLFGLITGDPALLDGLCRIAQPGATLDLRLNAGASLEAGVSLIDGGALVAQGLRASGFHVGTLRPLDAPALRACNTTWAKRLAFGRDPHAIYLRAQLPARTHVQMWSE